MHKSIEEMVQELVRKSNLVDRQINAEVGVDDVMSIDVTAVLNRAELLAEARVFPLGEMHRAQVLARSIHAARRVIRSSAEKDSEASRLERHHDKMSNGLNPVAHLDTAALSAIDEAK